MDKLNQLPDQQYILGNLFVVANKLEKVMDQALKPFEITSKQWILAAVIELFDTAPTIKEISNAMGTSHQNIKQVALKLEQKELLNLKKDAQDKRVTRAELNATKSEFWESTQPEGELFSRQLFKDIDSNDLTTLRKTITQILSNLEALESNLASDRVLPNNKEAT